MTAHNGEQLYGLRRVLTSLRMGLHPELRGLSLAQKLAIYRVSKESKLTRLNGRVYQNTFTPYWPSAAYDRFMRGLVATGTGTPTPVIINFAVTALCICKCWHCSFSNRVKRDQLSLDELKTGIAAAQDLGASVIGFTGGEPLLRDDLEQIIAAVDERSMPLLFTTGYKLTAERVAALEDAGLGVPVVSLDHYDPAKHDAGRGVQGMHAYALKAIELFKAAGFYTCVSFVPTRALLDEPDEFWKVLDFIRDQGVNDMRLTSPILSGNLTARPEEALEARHVQLIHEAQRRSTHSPGEPGMFAYDYFEGEEFYGCGAGYNYVFVDSLGNVCPCDFTMMSFGSIRDQPLGEIWSKIHARFQVPGRTCYATKIAGHVAALESDRWPLSEEDSVRVHEQCPSYDECLPRFHREMGCRAP
ncbi:MAG: radical SAM protein [Deltaproteobacteria bacterium]|nr:radical SAM protein [Deltaproteobacteria bacterium]